MKKMKLLLIAGLVSLTLVGCGSVNINDSTMYYNCVNDAFKDTGISTHDNYVYLVYNVDTHIVYYLSNDNMTPYINENGKYAKFDEDTKELIQID